MARKFGWVRKLPSGRYQASYISPDGVRVNAPTTFTTQAHADKWLAAQRTDIERETLQALDYAARGASEREVTLDSCRPGDRSSRHRASS